MANNKTVKKRLKLKYGDKTIITEKKLLNNLLFYVKAAEMIFREYSRIGTFDNQYYAPPSELLYINSTFRKVN